jgi:3-hydroxybutyryl-CoA dehydratase
MPEIEPSFDNPLPEGAKFTREFVVSESVYAGFIQTFNDRNPYHVSDDAARAKGFAGKIMHGNILNGFVSYFVGECLPIKSVVIQSQEIKFHKPVYLNDTVTLHAEVTEFHESVRTAEFSYHFVNQNNLKVARGKLFVGLL